MAVRMSLTAFSLLMSIFGIVFSSLGTFIKEWWIDENGKTQGLLTSVTCQEYICQLSTDGTDGWIVFVRGTSYAQFILFILAFLTTAAGRLFQRAWLTFVAMWVLSIACVTSIIHTFTAIGYYSKMSEAVINVPVLPNQYLLYQTLPVGLNAIAGTFCVPAFISLAIRQTKETKGPVPKNLVI